MKSCLPVKKAAMLPLPFCLILNQKEDDGKYYL
jgi:hypothetical protein